MNLVLHLPPETGIKLLEQARAAGVEAESLALEALSEKLASGQAAVMLPPDAVLASMPRGNPAVDFSRDSIYDGRGDRSFPTSTIIDLNPEGSQTLAGG